MGANLLGWVYWTRSLFNHSWWVLCWQLWWMSSGSSADSTACSCIGDFSSKLSWLEGDLVSSWGSWGSSNEVCVTNLFAIFFIVGCLTWHWLRRGGLTLLLLVLNCDWLELFLELTRGDLAWSMGPRGGLLVEGVDVGEWDGGGLGSMGL